MTFSLHLVHSSSLQVTCVYYMWIWWGSYDVFSTPRAFVFIAGHVRVLFVDLVGSYDVFSTPRALDFIAGHMRVLFVDLVGSYDVFSTSRALVFIAGHVRVLYLGLVGNICRFLYISWLRDPWWVLPFEFVTGKRLFTAVRTPSRWRTSMLLVFT